MGYEQKLNVVDTLFDKHFIDHSLPDRVVLDRDSKFQLGF